MLGQDADDFTEISELPCKAEWDFVLKRKDIKALLSPRAFPDLHN